VAVRLENADRLVFSVKDTGRGIGREEQERIFREFVRLRSAEGVDGFGLGLSIVDRLVRLLGGSIRLESVPGEGSEFIVSVPVGVPPAHPESTLRSGAGLRLLWVDDDPLQLEMTAALCRAEGIEAASCPYPEYAARLVAEQRFDAVFTDIQMPSMDGFRVLEAIRSVRSDLPVVAVSARSEPMPEGFAGVLRKPFSAAELLELLDAIVGLRPAAPADAESAAGGATVAGFEALTAFAGDDAAAAREILRTFAEQNAEACDRLCEALAADDARTVRALAHRMAPIFTMLGTEEVASALRILERCGEPVDEEVRRLTLRTVESVRRIVAEAQKRVSLQSV
ncbi:MAG TPA: hybrid sensor histidine kinase/response regulator, partial [Alistipes sp.]|nr:hybrid sensor histidine kinase/response regulator [Alistipes sp.]